MPARVTERSTGRFIDIWAYFAIAAAGSMFVAGFVSLFLLKSLVSTQVSVTPDQTTRLNPITINPQSIGALRIDVKARIPTNRWLTYDVQVEDQQGKVLAVGRKQAWRESGTWREEGESGTWREESLNAGLDVLSTQSEPIVVAISVADYTTTTNQPLRDPVTFQVRIRDGVIDPRYLWGGFWGALLLGGLALFAVRTQGRWVINHTMADSDLNARAIMGGRNQLLRVQLKVIADETAPRTLQCKLVLKDGMGQRINTPTLPISLARSRDSEGDVQGARGATTFFLQLNRRSSYGFYVELTPDRSVESTQLLVKEGIKTLFPVSVVAIDL